MTESQAIKSRVAQTATALIVGGLAATAQAQEVPKPVFEAQDRLDPGTDIFDPPGDPDSQYGGITAGLFKLRPSLAAAVMLDSNVRPAPVSDADVAGIIEPRLVIQSESQRYSLNGFALARLARYADARTENVEEWQGGFQFRLPMSQILRLDARAEGGRYIEDRADSFSPTAALNPVAYDRINGRIGLNATPGRLVIVPSFTVDRLAYHDNFEAAAPTVVRPESSRSLVRYGPTMLLGYTVSLDTLVYVGGDYNWRNYDRDVGPTRDSHGYAIYGGVRFRPSRLTRLDVALGWQRQDYRLPYRTPDGLYFNASADWSVTPLTLVSFDLTRDISESGSLLSGGIVRTRANLGVRHELLRTLRLEADVSLRNYRIEDLARSVRRANLGLGANYDVGRNIDVTARLDWRINRGRGALSLPAEDFERARVTVGVRYSL